MQLLPLYSSQFSDLDNKKKQFYFFLLKLTLILKRTAFSLVYESKPLKGIQRNHH